MIEAWHGRTIPLSATSAMNTSAQEGSADDRLRLPGTGDISSDRSARGLAPQERKATAVKVEEVQSESFGEATHRLSPELTRGNEVKPTSSTLSSSRTRLDSPPFDARSLDSFSSLTCEAPSCNSSPSCFSPLPFTSPSRLDAVTVSSFDPDLISPSYRRRLETPLVLSPAPSSPNHA